MTKILIRLGVIIIWVGIISLVLYFPKWNWRKHENHINIFAWGDILEPTVIADFEKETGIKVHLNYYSSNEELLVKLKATKGQGYDLIIPSDYAVKLLRFEGLLKEIDKHALHFWDRINPLLLDHPFDPDNRYSIPFEWELLLIGIDKNYFEGKTFEPSWKMIFDKNIINYRIAMVNDPRDAIQLAAFYLYGPIDRLNNKRLAEIEKLLIEQKNWVEAYASFRADYFLATKNCPVVVASSSYILRAMRKYPFTGFILPKEGTFVTIENFAIPIASSKEKLVYKLINYLFRPSSLEKHYQSFGFFPSTFSNEKDLLIPATAEEFDKFRFVARLASEQKIDKLWVQVKATGEVDEPLPR